MGTKASAQGQMQVLLIHDEHSGLGMSAFERSRKDIV